MRLWEAPSEMANSKSQQMKKIATDWAQNTTFNGVPHVLNASNRPKKLFWFLVVSAGVGEWFICTSFLKTGTEFG